MTIVRLIDNILPEEKNNRNEYGENVTNLHEYVQYVQNGR